MADPIRIRAAAGEGVVNVRSLMNHPMETGLRRDPAGNRVPAHFIESVTVTWRGKTVLSAQWGPFLSRNPYLEFNFRGGHKGENIQIRWTDNRGDTRTDETTII